MISAIDAAIDAAITPLLIMRPTLESEPIAQR